jgi:hypothetical protein
VRLRSSAHVSRRRPESQGPLTSTGMKVAALTPYVAPVAGGAVAGLNVLTF